MMLAAETRMPRIGFASLSRPQGLGSWFSKATKAVSQAFQDIGDETQRAWDRVRAEARRTGNRVGDQLEQSIHDISSRDWWVNTVARTVSRVVASELLIAIATFVYPPLALVATYIQGFLARWKADFVGTPEFWAVADPDDTNKFLAEVVTAMNQIDLFMTLPTLAVTELTIQAQTSRQKRDELRLQIAEIQANWASQKWVVIARAAFEAAQLIVVTIVTLGAGTVIVLGEAVLVETIIELGRMMISAATTLLQVQQMREITRIAKSQQQKRKSESEARERAEMAAIQAEIDRLNAEIMALGGEPVESSVEGAIADAGAPYGISLSALSAVPTGVVGAALVLGAVLLATQATS